MLFRYNLNDELICHITILQTTITNNNLENAM